MIYSASKIIQLHLYYLRALFNEKMIIFIIVGLLILLIALKSFLDIYFSKGSHKRSLLKKFHIIFLTTGALLLITLVLSIVGMISIHVYNSSSYAQHDYQVVHARMCYRPYFNIKANNIHLQKKLHYQYKIYKCKHSGHVSPKVYRHYHILDLHYTHQIVKYNDRDSRANILRRQAVIDIKPSNHLMAIRDIALQPWNLINQFYLLK